MIIIHNLELLDMFDRIFYVCEGCIQEIDKEHGISELKKLVKN